jgi:hypothetical protein
MAKKRKDSRPGQGARGPTKKKKVLLLFSSLVAISPVLLAASQLHVTSTDGYNAGSTCLLTSNAQLLPHVVQAKAAPLPEAPDDSGSDVSDEDVNFVDEYSQRLGFLTSLNREQIDRSAVSPMPCYSYA